VLRANRENVVSAIIARIKVQGAYTGERQMAAIDIGDREGTSSAGDTGCPLCQAVGTDPNATQRA
jgi:hypothetical protein